MRIWFMLGRRKDPSEIVDATTALLRRRGIEVEHEVAEDAVVRLETWRGGRDLHVVKAYTDLSLSLGMSTRTTFPAFKLARILARLDRF